MQRRRMSIMIRLENIKAENDMITCIAFFEDCKTPIPLIYHVDLQFVEDVQFPVGYEWCINHIKYAVKALDDMMLSGIMEDSKTVMWY